MKRATTAPRRDAGKNAWCEWGWARALVRIRRGPALVLVALAGPTLSGRWRDWQRRRQLKAMDHAATH